FLDVAPQVGHPGTDSAERDEMRGGDPGDQPRQRGLAATRWSPQDHRADPILLDGAAQFVLGTDQVLLPHELVERARPHPGGERLVSLRRLGRCRKEGFLGHQVTIEAGRKIVRWSRSGATPSDDLDRKSTRLNSSHVAISYAVFCLKKKNKRERQAKVR